jgi:hypothetical protein
MSWNLRLFGMCDLPTGPRRVPHKICSTSRSHAVPRYASIVPRYSALGMRWVLSTCLSSSTVVRAACCCIHGEQKRTGRVHMGVSPDTDSLRSCHPFRLSCPADVAGRSRTCFCAAHLSLFCCSAPTTLTETHIRRATMHRPATYELGRERRCITDGQDAADGGLADMWPSAG